MEWISVDDRLPDNDCRLIVFWIGLVSCGKFSKKHNGFMADISVSTLYSDYDDEVTHWMPLPELPKK